MVERFAAHTGRLHEHAQIVNDLILTGKVVETPGAQCPFKFFVGIGATRLPPNIVIFLFQSKRVSPTKLRNNLQLSKSDMRETGGSLRLSEAGGGALAAAGGRETPR